MCFKTKTRDGSVTIRNICSPILSGILEERIVGLILFCLQPRRLKQKEREVEITPY